MRCHQHGTPFFALFNTSRGGLKSFNVRLFGSKQTPYRFPRVFSADCRVLTLDKFKHEGLDVDIAMSKYAGGVVRNSFA